MNRPHPLRQAAARGFTLVELLVTITILGLLLMVAVPSFNEAVLGNKLGGFANNFIATAQLARSEAIKRNAPVTMCMSADGASCAGAGGWQQGWIVFNDRDGDGNIDADETRIAYQQAIGTEYSFTGGVNAIQFLGTGLNTTDGMERTLVLCRLLPTVGKQEREIKISPSGRVSSARTTTGTCP